MQFETGGPLEIRKIHDDNTYGDDEIDYLVPDTVPGSRVGQVVESFPVIAENYTRILHSLGGKIFKLTCMCGSC